MTTKTINKTKRTTKTTRTRTGKTKQTAAVPTNNRTDEENDQCVTVFRARISHLSRQLNILATDPRYNAFADVHHKLHLVDSGLRDLMRLSEKFLSSAAGLKK